MQPKIVNPSRPCHATRSNFQVLIGCSVGRRKQIHVSEHARKISLFPFPEIALYALDVYYNQTYGNGGGGFKRNDDFGGNNNGYPNADSLPLFYRDYPKYRDPFVDTYRSLAERRAGMAGRVLKWISLALET